MKFQDAKINNKLMLNANAILTVIKRKKHRNEVPK